MSVHTLHCIQVKKIPSHSSIKSRPLWPAMIDGGASIHDRRNLLKPTKNVLPRKQIVVAEVCGETYFLDSFSKGGL